MATKKSGTKTTSKSTTTKRKVSPQKLQKEIEVRAYEIYLNRVENYLPGDNFSDWEQAEREIKGKYGMV